jgi:2-methylcitrate dehydratase PrpD
VSAATATTAAERLVAFALGLRADAIPAEVRAAAALHALDTLGCGLAAHAVGVGTEGRTAAAAECPAGPATAIGHPDGLPPAGAALANGALCHGLDYDDTHSGAVSHVGAVVVPAALAAAEVERAPGPELLAALVAGGEVMIRLGLAAPGRFHAHGFHPTSVCGIFGAVAAVARLRRLAPRQAVAAMGIAGSLASGIFAYLSDGSATKRVHPGWAAHGAVFACGLAAAGLTGPAAVLEDRFGLLATHVPGEDVDLDGQLADLGRRWETPRTAFKPFPACHYLHAAVDAARAAAAQDGPLDPADVEEVVALVPEAAIPIVLEPAAGKLAPRSEYEAKFSLPYSVAAMLVHGRVDVLTYTDEAIADPRVLELARRVRYEPHDFGTYPGAFPGGVRLRLRDGRERRAELPHQRGAPEHPMTADEVLEKFRANAALALPDDEVEALAGATLGLADLDQVTGAFAALGRAGARAAQEVTR